MSDDLTQEMLRRARDGDKDAQRSLLLHYRAKLVKLIKLRMDDRLVARFDPSDVVQETLLDAARSLPDYLDAPSESFYPWLRGLAMNRLIDLYRHHLLAEKRTVRKERDFGLPDESKYQLVDRFMAKGSSPSGAAQRREMQRRVRAAIDLMEPRRREVLVLRYLEDLPVEEMAEILNVSVRTIWRWHRDAIAELTEILAT